VYTVYLRDIAFAMKWHLGRRGTARDGQSEGEREREGGSQKGRLREGERGREKETLRKR
jgi:hypothetical protein